MKNSENFNFKLPENTDASSLDYYNDNFKSIDKNLKAALNPATTIVIDTINIENTSNDKVVINCNGMRYCGRNYVFQRIIFEKGFLNSNSNYYIKAINVQNPNTETIGTLTANLSVVEYTGNINAINDEFILATFSTDLETMYTLHSLRYYPNSYVDDWLEQHRMYTYPILKSIGIQNVSETTKIATKEVITIAVEFYQNGFLISCNKNFDSYVRSIDLNTATETENVYIKPNSKYAICTFDIRHQEYAAIGFCDLKLIEFDSTLTLEEQLESCEGIIATFATSENGAEPYQFGLYKENSLAYYPRNIVFDNIEKLQQNKAEQSQVDSIADGLTNKTAYSLGVAGLYDESNELIKSWDKLIADGDITVVDNAITGNNLTNSGKLIIDSSITSIGEHAFIDATVTDIVIPNSVTSIGTAGFDGCDSLINITIPDSITIINNYTFSSCTSLTSITIPDSITSIGQNAFANCTSLINVKLSHNLTSIELSAFSYCSNLKSLEIPKGITVISGSTFEGCSLLESITIPNSVTSIEYGAFIDCDSLTDVYFKGTKTQWNSIAIGADNTPLTNATIHYELTNEVYNALNNKADKTSNTNDHNKFISDLNYTGSTAERIAFTESGKYIKTGVSVGTVVSLTSLTDYSFNYTIIDCNAGDYFYVNASGGNLARAWAFIDKDNKLLSKSNENVEYHGELKAPTNAKKLIVNTKCKEFYCYKGRTLKNRIAANETEITSIKNNYANINKINMHDVVIPLGIPENDKTNQMLTFPNFVYNGIYYYVQNAEMEYVEYELNTPYYVYAELEDVSEQYGNATLSISTDSDGAGKKPYCQFKRFDGNSVSYIFYCNNVFTLGLGDKFRAIDNKFNRLSDTYLKKTDASNTYLKKTDASRKYLDKTDAIDTYLKKTDASRKYLKKTDYHYPIVKGYASGSNLIVTDIAPVVHNVKINGMGNTSVVTTGKNILDTTSFYMPLGEAIHDFESEFIPARIMQGDYKLVVNESWEDGLTAYISFYDITQTQIGEEIILDNTPNFHCPYYSDLYGESNGLTTSSVSSIKIRLVYGVNDSDTFTLNSLMLTLQSCSNEYEEYKPHGIYVTDETGLLELSSSNLFTGINLILGADISIEYNRDIGVVLNELLGGTT